MDVIHETVNHKLFFKNQSRKFTLIRLKELGLV